MRDNVVSSRHRSVLRVLPVVVVTVAWTTHLGVASSVQGNSGQVSSAAPLPMPESPLLGPQLPSHAPDLPITSVAPVALAAPLSARVGVGATAAALIGRPDPSDIPSTALAAYQRAEAVINTANAECHLTWQLLAAVGRVESDHGRFGGASLDEGGVAVPAILGPALDGTGRTAVIADTDAGQYDGDVDFDRAVGPMQFIPSTWSALGVDADGDGMRNPQDIDDSALAAAVYLCSGGEDLASSGGRRSAIFRYNHSGAYVDLVLAIADAYRDGDYTSTGSTLLTAGSLPDAPVLTTSPAPVVSTPPPAPPAPPSPSATREPVAAQADEQSAAEETPPTQAPTDEPTDPPTDPPTEEPTEPGPTEPGPGTLTPEEAAEHCTEMGLVDDPEVDDDAYDACVLEFTRPEEPDPPPSPTAQPSPTDAPTEQTP